MSNGSRDERRVSGFGLLLALPVMAVLYVFSIGPVVYIAEKTGIDQKPLRVFYTPVIWLHDKTPLREPLEKWGELWGWN